MTPKTLLAVLAHPDDESFGMGGTLALYASRGVDVHLVCATRGEVGAADDEHLKGFASIGEMREAELRCAAGILGLKGVYFLGYRDSGMPGTEDNCHPEAQVQRPVEEVAGKVVHYIRTLKPDVVVTFDPIGGYHHPDHIHIHQATALAFEKAAHGSFQPETGAPYAPGALYFHTIPRGFLKFAVRLLRLFGKDPSRWGQNGDIDLAAIAAVDFPTHARIDIRPVLSKKEAASDCHSSQGGGQMRRGFTGKILRLFGGYETFMRAHPPVQPGEPVRRDFFEQ
jgi:LmbE family N-acetylglucosaminyl deacetylase